MWWHQCFLLIPSPALYIHLSALYIPLPLNKFPINDEPEVPNNIRKIGKAPPFFTSFCNVFVTPFTKISASSKAFAIFTTSFIPSSLNIAVVPESCIFF